MFRLRGNDGDELSLDVVSYQFPSITNDEWDSEWVVVVGVVKTREGTWSFRDPCLTTFELRSLIDWLHAVKADEQQREITFTEPNLRFGSAGDSVYISFSQESAPPWTTDDEKLGAGVAVRFPLAKNDLHAAADALERMLQRFPIRAAKRP